MPENASWFNVDIIEEKNVVRLVVNNGREIIKAKLKKTRRSISSENYEYEVLENIGFAFDHAKVIVMGAERLKNRIVMMANERKLSINKMSNYILEIGIYKLFEEEKFDYNSMIDVAVETMNTIKVSEDMDNEFSDLL